MIEPYSFHSYWKIEQPNYDLQSVFLLEQLPLSDNRAIQCVTRGCGKRKGRDVLWITVTIWHALALLKQTKNVRGSRRGFKMISRECHLVKENRILWKVSAGRDHGLYCISLLLNRCSKSISCSASILRQIFQDNFLSAEQCALSGSQKWRQESPSF